MSDVVGATAELKMALSTKMNSVWSMNFSKALHIAEDQIAQRYIENELLQHMWLQEKENRATFNPRALPVDHREMLFRLW